MIKKLVIKNFQSHANSELNFHEKINIISGKTDCGKSSIRKAISFLINNKPNNDRFIKKGEKETIIELDDVKRIKGKKNSYVFKNDEYSSFGVKVPDQINDYFNFSELNIQSQFDPPFLLGSSPGEVSRFLNRIVNLEIIDESLKTIESMRRESTNNFNSKKKEEIELKEKVQSFDWIADFEKELEEVNEINEKVETEEIKINKYKQYAIELSNNELKNKEMKIKLQYEKEINELLEENNIIENKSLFLDKLNSKLKELRMNIKINLNKNEKILFLSDKLKKEIGDICPLCNQGIK